MSKDAKRQKERRRREQTYRERRASRDYLKPKPRRDSTSRIGILLYEVSFDAIPDTTPASLRFEEAVPPDEAEKVYDQAKYEPALAIPQLEKWCREFPDVPRIFNWLATAYSIAGDEARSQEISHNLYERFPDYLFAIVTECHRHIDTGDLDWVARRLHRKWEVKLLYPDRNVFHFTEVRAFHHMLVRYFIAAKDIPQAELSLEMLNQMDPDDEVTVDARWLIAKAKIGAGLFSRMASVLRRNILGGIAKAAAPPREEDDEILPEILPD
jgi:hypothetical protein